MKNTIKNYLLGSILLAVAFFIKLPGVSAASAKISVSASTNTAIVGSSFKVTVNVSSNASIGSWEYTLGYDSSKARLTGGQLHVVDYGNGSKRSASYSYTFVALSSGTVTFKPINASVLDYTTTNEVLSGVNSSSVRMMTQAELESTYSKNNNLSSLLVEGAELSPVFNKDVTEYSVTLPIDTTQINISAIVADKTASVSGTGVVLVNDGLNKVEIVVTAQHGEKKNYIINATVLELDPIKVKIGKKEYSIVRKAGQVTELPVGFTETKIKIENQEVAAYTSEVAKLTLVGLKDKSGKIKLYIYDEKTKSYTSYVEIKSLGSNLFILNNVKNKAPIGFVKTTVKYGLSKINAWKYKEDHRDEFSLVYALNLDTGIKTFYTYDSKDNTFQRYYEEMNNIKDEKIKLSSYAAFGLFMLLVLVILIFIITLIKKAFTSNNKKIAKLELKISKLKAGKRQVIAKKVENDEYPISKKEMKLKQQELIEARKKLNSDKSRVRRVSLEEDE
ncbi:MAG: hypothetical protein RSA10_03650 [Bacilli bacterium]